MINANDIGKKNQLEKLKFLKWKNGNITLYIQSNKYDIIGCFDKIKYFK